MRLAGRNVVVLGLGISGVAAALFCARRGGRVMGVDRRLSLGSDIEHQLREEGVRLHLGDDTVVADADALVLVSPGVDPRRRDLDAARQAGAELSAEIELALQALAEGQDEPELVAVSGTNGKSTTVALIEQILSGLGQKVFAGANFGRPLVEAVSMDLDTIVAEFSSYQLEQAASLRPRVGVLMNVQEDHLARHGTMDVYAAIKALVLQRVHENGLAIYDHDDPRCVAAAANLQVKTASFGSQAPAGDGAWCTADTMFVRLGECKYSLDLSDFGLLGEHNRRNLMAAVLTCAGLGITPDQSEALIVSLKALPHRLEAVPTNDGRRWINDSKSTNVAATIVSLAAVTPPVVLLMGGQGKGESYRPLAQRCVDLRAVVTFGEEGPAIADTLEGAGCRVQRSDDLASAVDRARSLAAEGTAIVLSPACASWDAYGNFGERGAHFRALAAGGAS